MILKVIAGQRKCSYPGEHAPEIFECMTEFQYDENPEWLNNKFEEARVEVGKHFVSLKIIDINVSQEAIERILKPESVMIPGEVKG